MEIERKWIPKKMPNLSKLQPLRSERYFLYHKNGTELRIQSKGTKYELERKSDTSDLSHTKEKILISKEEFNTLKKFAKESLIRDNYKISDSPNISLKVYHGKFKGLVRIEVEFSSEKEAKNFKPLPWFGKEITNLAIGRDSKLITLSDKEFKKQLANLSD